MSIQQTAELYKVIGEANRLRILHLLAHRGEICVCDLGLVMEVPQVRISKHLMMLRHAGLVEQRRVGNWILNSLATPEETLHACQVRVFLECFPQDQEFAQDLARYDQLLSAGQLMQCNIKEVLANEDRSVGAGMPKMQTTVRKRACGCRRN